MIVVGAGPAGPAGGDRRGAQRPPRHRARAARQQAGGQVRLAASVPNRAEFGDLVRNQLTECRRLGVTIEYGVGVDGRSWSSSGDPTHVIVATGAEPASGRGGCRPTPTERGRRARRARRASASPSGDVVVVDELGFHQATSVAELLADRGCRVEIITPGHGRRPGPRHHPRHGELVDAGQRQGHRPDRPTWCRWAWAATHAARYLLHHPTGRQRDPHARLGRAGRAGQPGRVAVPRAEGTQASASSASATASPPPCPRRGGRRRTAIERAAVANGPARHSDAILSRWSRARWSPSSWGRPATGRR